MSLRNREDHSVFYRAGVKFRRTHQIAYIFQDCEIQILGTQFPQSLSGHIRVQVAHSSGVELNGSDTGGADGLGIYGGIDIRLHNADVQL